MLFAVSCSDDDGGSGGFSSAELVGTWDLVAVNVSTAVDIDGDGTSSSNLMDEEGCITGTIVLKDDTTYQYEQSNFTITPITNGQYALQCSGITQATGAWGSDGIQVAFQGSTILGTLQLSNNTIIKQEGDNLPGVASYVYERR
ncbi:hypothetical protein D2V08_16900 [Flagellimonas lutimaris]|uniref:Lipocalin-like domain-containing protein n=2 Tax=Flagellimonas lutimaris TaxID=475082 RepID=A0A3A1N643_9FLAO|nr:hypothetical protein D2V08_16900 [Allomuricauda lutimaris]